MTSLSDAERGLRGDALRILEAALRGVDPEPLVRGVLEGSGPEHAERARRGGGRLLLVAVGKAALPMAVGAVTVLGDAVGEGIVLTPEGSGGTAPDGFRVFRGGHPLPTPGGLEGARHIMDRLGACEGGDRVLLLLSGGGSALLTMPAADVSLQELREVTEALLLHGATIVELNAVRKHLEALKGGRLAAAAAPAALNALVLSDVVGDPLDVIASGPVSPDPSTYEEAIGVLRTHDLWSRVPDTVREHLVRGRDGELPETPKAGDPVFEHVEVTVIGNAALAARTAAAEAERLGYVTRVESTELTGEAREVGATLGAALVRGADGRAELESGRSCVVNAGETTVTVTGDGRGGRNQELVLAAAPALAGRPGLLLLSAGTDGLDGPTDAAGALVTGTTLERAEAAGLDPVDHLDRNDSYAFFDALGDLLRTGPTGTNVMDLMLSMAIRD